MRADDDRLADDEPISLLLLYQDVSSVESWIGTKQVKKFKASERRWAGTLSNTKIDATASPSFDLNLLSGSNYNEVYFNRGNDKLNLRGSNNSIFMSGGQNEANVNGNNNIVRTGDFSNSKSVVRSHTKVTGQYNKIFLSASGETATVNGIGNQVKGEGTGHTINVLGQPPRNNVFNAFLSLSSSRINIGTGDARIALVGEKNNIFFTFPLNDYVQSSMIDGRGYFGWVNTINYSYRVHTLNLYDGNFEVLPGSDLNEKPFSATINLYYTSSKYQIAANRSSIRLSNVNINSYGHNVLVIGSNNIVSAKADGATFSFIGSGNSLGIDANRGTVTFVGDQTSSINIDLDAVTGNTNWGTIELPTTSSQSINFRTRSRRGLQIFE